MCTVWTRLTGRIAEEPTPNRLCADPVGELVKELENVQDPEQLRQYALWLVKRDPEQCLNVSCQVPMTAKLTSSC